jgi:flagellar basal body-associated protein FliL
MADFECLIVFMEEMRASQAEMKVYQEEMKTQIVSLVSRMDFIQAKTTTNQEEMEAVIKASQEEMKAAIRSSQDKCLNIRDEGLPRSNRGLSRKNWS